MPTTQGCKTNCKKSDEAIVAMKHVKACGAKGRNTNAFLEGKHAIALEVMANMGTEQQDIRTLSVKYPKLETLMNRVN